MLMKLSHEEQSRRRRWGLVYSLHLLSGERGEHSPTKLLPIYGRDTLAHVTIMYCNTEIIIIIIIIILIMIIIITIITIIILIIL